MNYPGLFVNPNLYDSSSASARGGHGSHLTADDYNSINSQEHYQDNYNQHQQQLSPSQYIHSPGLPTSSSAPAQTTSFSYHQLQPSSSYLQQEYPLPQLSSYSNANSFGASGGDNNNQQQQHYNVSASAAASPISTIPQIASLQPTNNNVLSTPRAPKRSYESSASTDSYSSHYYDAIPPGLTLPYQVPYPGWPRQIAIYSDGTNLYRAPGSVSTTSPNEPSQFLRHLQPFGPLLSSNNNSNYYSSDSASSGSSSGALPSICSLGLKAFPSNGNFFSDPQSGGLILNNDNSINIHIKVESPPPRSASSGTSSSTDSASSSSHHEENVYPSTQILLKSIEKVEKVTPAKAQPKKKFKTPASVKPKPLRTMQDPTNTKPKPILSCQSPGCKYTAKMQFYFMKHIRDKHPELVEAAEAEIEKAQLSGHAEIKVEAQFD